MIPDDEPWWKVRETIDGESTDERSMSTAAAIGDRYGGILCLPCTCPLAAEDIAMAVERQQAIKAEPASETLQALDTLPFRPIGYEW